jgi:uncharacterized membrane protein YdjX (TVP38/TMEM64 family)
MAEAAAPPRPALAQTILRSLLLVAGLAAAGFAFRSLPHDFAARAHHLNPITFIALGAAACSVSLPRQAVAFAGGYAHGIWYGGALAFIAQMLGCIADLLWARVVARGWVQGRLRGRFGPRLARLDRLMTAHPFRATLTLRLLPVGNSAMVSLLAGSLGISPIAFLAATAIGYLPQTIVFVLLGSGVRLAHGAQLALAAVALVISFALGVWLLRRDPMAERPTATSTDDRAAPTAPG